jgi:aspartyl/asparaginyl beta-hydroxylase (cupin superfamily)
MHLGLFTPQTSDGKPCATFRVGKDEPSNRRPWKQGEVLFFDDSYVHEVWNECGGETSAEGERVVLQVVIQHPLVRVQ